MEMFTHQVLLQNERMLICLLLRKKRGKLTQIVLRRMITWVFLSLETLAATPASPLRWRLKARPNWTGFDTTFANTPPARSMSATLPLPMSPITKRRISIVESPGRFTAEVLLDMNNSVIEEPNLNNSENRCERQASQGLLHSAARPSSMFAKTIQEVIQRPAKMPKLNNSNTMLVLNHALIMNILIILLLQVLLLFSSVGAVPKLKLNSQFYLKFINNFAVFSVHYKINNSTFI